MAANSLIDTSAILTPVVGVRWVVTKISALQNNPKLKWVTVQLELRGVDFVAIIIDRVP